MSVTMLTFCIMFAFALGPSPYTKVNALSISLLTNGSYFQIFSGAVHFCCTLLMFAFAFDSMFTMFVAILTFKLSGDWDRNHHNIQM